LINLADIEIYRNMNEKNILKCYGKKVEKIRRKLNI